MADKKPAKTQKAEVTRREQEAQTFVPPADIWEAEERVVIRMDMPGVGKNDVDIRVDRDTLNVKGTIVGEPAGSLIYEEQRLGDFERQFSLSDDLDREKISAQMDAGVLTITVGRAEKVKPRKIEILPGA